MLYNGIIRDISYKLLNPVVPTDKSIIRTRNEAVLARTGRTIQELQVGVTITYATRPSDGTKDFSIQVNNPVKGKVYSFNISKHSGMNSEYLGGGPGLFEDVQVGQIATENPDDSVTCGVIINAPSDCTGVTVVCLCADSFTASEDSYNIVSGIFGTDYEPTDDDCLKGFKQLTTEGSPSLCTGICNIYIGHFLVPGSTVFKHSRCVKDSEIAVIKAFLEKKTNDWDNYGGLKQYIYSIGAQDSTGSGYPFSSSEGSMADYIEGKPYVKECDCFINGPSCTMNESKYLLAFVEMDDEYKILNIGKAQHNLFMSYSNPGRLTDSMTYRGLAMDRSNQCTNVAMVLISSTYGTDIPDEVTSDSTMFISSVSIPNRYGTYVEPTLNSVLKKILSVETVIEGMKSDMDSNNRSFANWLNELYKNISVEGKINADQELVLSGIYKSNESMLNNLNAITASIDNLKANIDKSRIDIDKSIQVCNTNIDAVKLDVEKKGTKTVDILNGCTAGLALFMSMKRKNK